MGTWASPVTVTAHRRPLHASPLPVYARMPLDLVHRSLIQRGYDAHPAAKRRCVRGFISQGARCPASARYVATNRKEGWRKRQRTKVERGKVWSRQRRRQGRKLHGARHREKFPAFLSVCPSILMIPFLFARCSFQYPVTRISMHTPIMLQICFTTRRIQSDTAHCVSIQDATPPAFELHIPPASACTCPLLCSILNLRLYPICLCMGNPIGDGEEEINAAAVHSG